MTYQSENKVTIYKFTLKIKTPPILGGVFIACIILDFIAFVYFLLIHPLAYLIS